MLSRICNTRSITATNTRERINFRTFTTTTSYQTLATHIAISTSRATTPSAPTLPFRRSRKTKIFAKLNSTWCAQYVISLTQRRKGLGICSSMPGISTLSASKGKRITKLRPRASCNSQAILKICLPMSNSMTKKKLKTSESYGVIEQLVTLEKTFQILPLSKEQSQEKERPIE